MGQILHGSATTTEAVHQAQERSLIGMWVDPLMVDMHPEVFGRPADSGHCPFRIRESVGVNSLWELCWLDADLGPGVNDPGTIREILISALIGERKPRHPPPTCRFFPI